MKPHEPVLSDSPTPSSISNRSLYLGVGLISLAVLFVEVELTRVFSVMIWYHFSFFVISTVG